MVSPLKVSVTGLVLQYLLVETSYVTIQIQNHQPSKVVFDQSFCFPVFHINLNKDQTLKYIVFGYFASIYTV
jgi:hypothetical protein